MRTGQWLIVFLVSVSMSVLLLGVGLIAGCDTETCSSCCICNCSSATCSGTASTDDPSGEACWDCADVCDQLCPQTDCGTADSWIDCTE